MKCITINGIREHEWLLAARAHKRERACNSSRPSVKSKSKTTIKDGTVWFVQCGLRFTWQAV